VNSTRLFALACAAILPGCSRLPEAFSPPQQIELPSGPEPAATPIRNLLLLEMSDPDIGSHILADVLENQPGIEWRFTGPHPRFRLQWDAPPPPKLVFYLRFYNHEEALKARGPVFLSITINGHTFRSDRFASNGDIEYRRQIPDEWIAGVHTIDIALNVDPPWRAPDGITYGVSIHSIGFVEP